MFITSKKLIAVVGPNASGKSEFAVLIAKKFNGEIISADSRQLYRHLNIGSGKVKGEWAKFSISEAEVLLGSARAKYDELINKKYFIYKDVIHHCIDFVGLKRVFSAGDFKNCAEKAILEIINRGRIPVICGGTGFYIDVLLQNVKLFGGEPNWELRRKLEEKSCEELFSELKKLNPERAEKIDKHNKRRLIRAIEIDYTALAEPYNLYGSRRAAQTDKKYDALYIGITHPSEILKQRIKHRLKERLENGMIDEVCDLRFKRGVSWKRLDDLGLEYRYISYYLREKIKTKEELAEILNNKIWQYAKRQITWFKRNKKINWIGLLKKDFKKSEKLIKKFLMN